MNTDQAYLRGQQDAQNGVPYNNPFNPVSEYALYTAYKDGYQQEKLDA